MAVQIVISHDDDRLQLVPEHMARSAKGTNLATYSVFMATPHNPQHRPLSPVTFDTQAPEDANEERDAAVLGCRRETELCHSCSDLWCICGGQSPQPGKSSGGAGQVRAGGSSGQKDPPPLVPDQEFSNKILQQNFVQQKNLLFTNKKNIQ